MSDKTQKNEIVLVAFEPDFAALMMKIANTQLPIKLLGRKWLVRHITEKSDSLCREFKIELAQLMEVQKPKRKRRK